MVRYLVLSIVLFFGVGTAAAATPPLFQTLEGEFVSLDQYTGDDRWLVVMVWASDCHVCNQEAHNYEAFHRDSGNVRVRMLGVSVDGWSGRAAAGEFVSRHKISFPNLIVGPQQMSAILAGLSGQGLAGTPTFLVFAPDGSLRGQQAGAVPVKTIRDFIRRETASGG